MTERTMIRATNLKKYYGSAENLIRAVDDASLEVSTGEFVAITGHSGSGKSTLLNLIGGMTYPDSGEINVAGRNVLALPDAELSDFRARTIGFIFQFQSMLPTLDALENVQLPLLFTRRKHGRQAALSLLGDMGLKDRIHAYSHELSAGQQRRVGIARALVNEPALLLCDEPTGDLDLETEAIIMDIINRANQNGATVLMTTHNPALCAFAVRTFTMENGRISPGTQ